MKAPAEKNLKTTYVQAIDEGLNSVSVQAEFILALCKFNQVQASTAISRCCRIEHCRVGSGLWRRGTIGNWCMTRLCHLRRHTLSRSQLAANLCWEIPKNAYSLTLAMKSSLMPFEGRR